MKPTKTLALIAATTFALSAFASQDENPDAAEKDGDKLTAEDLAHLGDGEIAFGGGVIGDISTRSGSRFVFLDLDGGVGLYEQTPAGGAMLQDHPQLRNATLLDVFLAVSEPGTIVPSQIEALSEPARLDRPQGWARDLDAGKDAESRANYCSNATFSNAVVSKGYNDRGTPSLRLDKKVGSTGFFDDYKYCGGTSWPGGCPTFHRYEVGGNNGSVWYNVDKYYTLVSLCGLGVHPTLTSNYGWQWVHPGPRVEIQYRNSNNNGWFTALSKDFAAGDIGQTAGWHYWGGTGVWNFDWRTRIEYAEINDKFDIGHAVEDLGY